MILALASSFETKILRLVKSARECSAIQSGQVDAILDPASGRAILLPQAQAALLECKARFRSLVELSSDGIWERDAHYRFVSHSGVAIGSERIGDTGIFGKTLWELPFDNSNEVDWQTHQTQLEWRAIFRDLELRCVDRTGDLHIISISGEPMFDAQAEFKGYCGVTRDITARRNRHTYARVILDTLATQVCVLDETGTIITVNAAWRVFAASHRGMLASALQGSNYLTVCDQILGNERVDAIAMVAGIRQVMVGERELFRYEYFCNAPSGQRWFMASVTRLHEDGGARDRFL